MTPAAQSTILAPLIEDMPPARLYEEVVKLFMGGAGQASYELLRRYGLFGHLFPETERASEAEPGEFAGAMVGKALENTDARIRAGKPVTPGFLFAALLWGARPAGFRGLRRARMPPMQAYEAAGADVIERQIHHVSLPRRFSFMVRQIWGLQPRGLVNRAGPWRRPEAAHPSAVPGRLRLPPAPGGVGPKTSRSMRSGGPGSRKAAKSCSLRFSKAKARDGSEGGGRPRPKRRRRRGRPASVPCGGRASP